MAANQANKRTEENNRRQQPKATEERNRGFFAASFDLMTGLLGWWMMCFIFSVSITVITHVFLWPSSNGGFERSTLVREVHYLTEDLSDSVLLQRLIRDSQQSVIWEIPELAEAGTVALTNLQSSEPSGLGAAVNMGVRRFIVRTMVLITSVPLTFFFLSGGLVLGLVERDLRRMNLARESSTKFNMMMTHGYIPFAGVLMFYLCWPTAAYPVPFILLCQLGLALYTFFAVATYKKYL